MIELGAWKQLHGIKGLLILPQLKRFYETSKGNDT